MKVARPIPARELNKGIFADHTVRRCAHAPLPCCEARFRETRPVASNQHEVPHDGSDDDDGVRFGDTFGGREIGERSLRVGGSARARSARAPRGTRATGRTRDAWIGRSKRIGGSRQRRLGRTRRLGWCPSWPFRRVRFRKGPAGFRASAAWVRVGYDDPLAQYTGELTLALGDFARFVPSIGAGGGLARTYRVDENGAHVGGGSNLGIGVLRAAVDYRLPLTDTDARAGISAMGVMPAIRASDAPDLSPWLMLAATVSIGF